MGQFAARQIGITFATILRYVLPICFLLGAAVSAYRQRHKGPDGGVDIEPRLFGVMTAERAVGGFVVASGQVTEEARRFVEGRSIELVDTQVLLKMVRDT